MIIINAQVVRTGHCPDDNNICSVGPDTASAAAGSPVRSQNPVP